MRRTIVWLVMTATVLTGFCFGAARAVASPVRAPARYELERPNAGYPDVIRVRPSCASGAEDVWGGVRLAEFDRRNHKLVVVLRCVAP